MGTTDTTNRKNKIMRQKLRLIPIFLVATLAFVSLVGISMTKAQTSKATPAQSQRLYEVANGSVTVFGQTLNPRLRKFREMDSDYTWDDLKFLVPKLLPDAQQQTYSADEVCERLHKLNKQYLMESEKRTNYLIYKMEFVVNEGRAAAPADLALTGRLASKAPEALKELFNFMPSEKERIESAKAVTLASLAMLMLYDAAQENCREYAKNKGFYQVTVPVTQD